MKADYRFLQQCPRVPQCHTDGGRNDVLRHADGLIGYTADEVRRRGKEIAIRKVNGAEASSILELLSKDVLVVALPAVVLGTLASWYINGIWMEQFAEQVPLGWVVYLLVVIANLAVIVGCVLWKSWRIANENPVNSIKSE